MADIPAEPAVASAAARAGNVTAGSSCEEPLASELPTTQSSQGISQVVNKDANPATAAPAGRRNARPPPPHLMPVELPATANEVTDLSSLSRVVTLLTTITIKAINEGKSVTTTNKKLIVAASAETQKAIQRFGVLFPNLVSHELDEDRHATDTATAYHSGLDNSNTLEELRGELKSCVDEVKKLRRVITSSPPIQPPTSTRTYASVIRTPPTTTNITDIPRNRPAIVVASKKEVANSTETLNAFRAQVSFRDTTFAPADVRRISKNKLMVEFDNVEHRDSTLAKINRQDSQITAEPSKKLQPMIILKGVSETIPHDQLVNIIVNQNETIKSSVTNESDLVFKFKRSNRSSRLYNAIFLTTPDLWRKMVSAGKINVDHQRVHVEDYIPLLQCYNCLQFGHTRKRCTEERASCSHCASETHGFKDCPNKLDPTKSCCFNCNKSRRGDLTDHSATSHTCPIVSIMTHRLRTRIDYG
ncbi:jg14537 [Pararge aegeria aegeria]|uniref:Jg14537 protein n=1 Tax=Pararge aegeria aegeria TaxID=348720 RepID=A0A8S4QV91_9NEOP|nr:jg14537 [Pararge aegeria aegeria]